MYRFCIDPAGATIFMLQGSLTRDQIREIYQLGNVTEATRVNHVSAGHC